MARKLGAPPKVTANLTRPVPLETNFDFLQGAFERAEKARRTSLGAALVALVTLTALVLLGFTATQSTNADRSAVQAANSSDASTVAKIGQLDQAGGIPADQLRAHAAARQGALKNALKNDVDLAAILSTLNASTPSGVKLTSVEFTGIGPAPAAGTATPGATGSAATPSGAAQPTSGQTLTVVASVKSFGDIGRWGASLKQVPGLEFGQPTWTGGNDNLIVTMTAKVQPASLSARAKKATAADMFGFDKGSN